MLKLQKSLANFVNVSRLCNDFKGSLFLNMLFTRKQLERANCSFRLHADVVDMVRVCFVRFLGQSTVVHSLPF